MKKGCNLPLVRHQKPNKTSYSESREPNPCSHFLFFAYVIKFELQTKKKGADKKSTP